MPFGTKDFTSILRKIEASGANVLVNTVVGADAITLVKQFTAAGLKSKIHIIFFGFSENYLAGLTNPEFGRDRHDLEFYLVARQARGQGIS